MKEPAGERGEIYAVANPTVQVQHALIPDCDLGLISYWYASGNNQKTYQCGQMIGLRTDGYASDFDDSASLQFLGILEGDKQQVDSATDGAYKLRVLKPKLLEFPLSSGTASRAADLGRIAYAYDAGKVTLDPSGLTYANPVGIVVDVRLSSEPGVSGAYVKIKPFYGIRPAEVASRTLAATGAQSLTRNDLGKVIFCPNTAALTVTLPAVAQTSPGDWIEFIKTTSDAYAVTLDGNASETINGSATYTGLNVQYEVKRIVSTGAAWLLSPQAGLEQAAVVAALTGTPTGTANGSIVDVAATAANCAGSAEPSATQVDTAIATAVASIVTGVNEQNSELMTKINAILTALKNANLMASA